MKTSDDVVDEIRALIGKAATDKFLALLAGTNVTFWNDPRARLFVRVAGAIGAEACERLCRHFDGEQVYIPMAPQIEARNEQINARVEAGDPYETIARHFGISTRQVRRIVATVAARKSEATR